MSRSTALLAGALGCCLALPVAPAAADPDRTRCPDHMVPTLAIFVKNGDKKDKNRDGMVCAKPADCTTPEGCQGSRDYDVFGAPLEGLDGLLYYVSDNDVS